VLIDFKEKKMTVFTEAQKAILTEANYWFQQGCSYNIIGSNPFTGLPTPSQKATESFKMYHKLTDQVLEESGAELWEIIEVMGA